jgi:hypothetical protein
MKASQRRVDFKNYSRGQIETVIHALIDDFHSKLEKI